jgi:alpha-ketoglutarate-dependent taurine dioxygenase
MNPNSDTLPGEVHIEVANDIMIIKPQSVDNQVVVLKNWLDTHQDFIAESLTKYGAVLFRGFQVNQALDFEQVALGIDKELKNNYLGTSPRNAKTDYVFSASELPPYYPIPQHCEMSFLPNPPRKIFFYCQIAPQQGGETPIVDFQKVYDQMKPAIRSEFEKKGIKIIRNYNGPNTKSGFDFWKLKRWDEMFLTADRQKATAICEENHFQYSWQANDRLRLISEQAAVRLHPQTQQKVWFNHSQVFHLAAAAIEYNKIAEYQRTWRSRFYAVLTNVMTFLKRNTQKTENQALHCTFLDGSEISAAYMQHVEDIIWQNMYFLKWQKGDVIALDNFRMAHGRMPYSGAREILVAWTS